MPTNVHSGEPGGGILIVGGSHECRYAYQAALANLGRTTHLAASDDEALRRLDAGEVAVMVLAIDAPGSLGLAAAQKIREHPRTHHTPTIVVLAGHETEAASATKSAGLVDFLVAPVPAWILTAKVRSCLELAQMRAELARSRACLEAHVRQRTHELRRHMERLHVEHTERRQAEDRLAIMVSELTHRVKNLLAVLQAVTRRTLTDERTVEDCRALLLGRLHALAHAHELLTNSLWNGASLADIVDTELAGFCDRIEAKGPHLVLTGGAVQSFALILHELATNAAKYGALSTSTGTVSIEWMLTGDTSGHLGRRYLEFVWREHGGPRVTTSSRKGFGMTLISMIAGAYTSDPSIVFSPNGLVCRMKIPLEVLSPVSNDDDRRSSDARRMG